MLFAALGFFNHSLCFKANKKIDFDNCGLISNIDFDNSEILMVSTGKVRRMNLLCSGGE